jgi:hypothetical protein
MTTTTEISYGLVVGGYRVKFTNWKGSNGNETFFATSVDAKNFLAKYVAYGYKGSVETIHFHVAVGA